MKKREVALVVPCLAAVLVGPDAACPDIGADAAGRRPEGPYHQHPRLHADRRLLLAAREEQPEVIKYLEAENAYTEAMMKPTKALQETLYKEMLGRIKQTDLSVPSRIGEYFYYSRTEEGQAVSVSCAGASAAALDARRKKILLDLNELAEGHKFLGLGAYVVSDDGNLLAYSTDTTGYRQYTLQVKDLRTGKTAAARTSSASARSSGPPTTRRSSTRPRTRSRSARTSSSATWSAPTRATWSTKRRTSSSTSASGARSTRR